VLHASRDPAGLAAAFVAGALIFVVLYTSLFSNVEGLFTGTVATDGTLLYWLGQHGYQRGNQPWFYYGLLMPQYEFAAVLFGVAGALGVVAAAARGLFRSSSVGPRFFFRFFLAVWFLGIFAALSWAGEKMPWLVVHFTLPAILLAASLLGGLVERWRTRVPAAQHQADGIHNRLDVATSLPRPGWRWGWGESALVAALLALGAGWLLLAGRLSYGAFVEGSETGGWTRAVTAGAEDRWWMLAIPPAVAAAAIALGWLFRGPRRTGRAVLASAVAGVLLLQIHAGWRTAYLEGDVPKDMLIYTQTSPDVSRMVREIDALSAELTGGKGMEVWYDSGVSWPLQWYLRDYPNRELRNGPLSGPPDDVPVVIVTNDRLDSMEPFLDNYTAQEYVLRWWFPESIYRDFAIAPELGPEWSAWDGSDEERNPLAIGRSMLESAASVLTAEGQQDLYRLLVYRDLPTPIGHPGGTYRYTVFVRNDLLPIFNGIRY
ncbi:MAG: TIGR03663 family protein, partial [Chloroflexota bacterium]|nr:TIGR03663 family protein [Chloroflexota bacterium]